MNGKASWPKSKITLRDLPAWLIVLIPLEVLAMISLILGLREYRRRRRPRGFEVLPPRDAK